MAVECNQVREGWNVRVSQQVLEWQSETQRTNLMRVLEKRFKAQVPSDLGAHPVPWPP